jgi:subtilase family serine protease
MKRRLTMLGVVVAAAAALAGTAAGAYQAPDSALATGATPYACSTPSPTVHYTWIHCYTPQDIRAAYGVNALGDPAAGTGLLGQGQTIVLVDSYGTPTGQADLQKFHDAFYPNLPNPDFTAVYPNGQPDYKNIGNGQSGSAAAAGWAGEANLDIEWSYAIAPLAHIVLIGVPPAETEGVQGFPNLFKAISQQIDANPPGTVFSMSFSVTEQTFGGAAQQQTARFDAVFQQGIAKGDTFFASSGDDGTTGVAKQMRDSATYPYPTVGWPASSPYVTAVGGTQLQYGWTWDPQSDIAFTTSGYNAPYWLSTPGGNTNVVWNESWLPAATGGGPSAIYPRPSWQSGLLGAQGDHRLVPDVAWNAAVNGGVLVYTSFFPQASRVGWHIYGGTSASSPQVAALTALAAQQAGHGLGNVNPAIYANAGAAFTDVAPVHQGAAGVISGDLNTNQMFQYDGDGLPVSWGPVPGWATTSGYDLTTGWGTPDAAAYVATLAGP